MTLEDRIEYHRHLAQGYHDAYALRAERGRVIFPDEWRMSRDAKYFSPYYGEGDIGQFMEDSAFSTSDAVNMEAIVYSAAFPDWGPTEFMCWPSPEGVAFRSKFEGTSPDGTKMSFWACDFVLTNEAGEVCRWETHVDGEAFGPVSMCAVGIAGPFEDMTVYWAALHKRLVELGHA